MSYKIRDIPTVFTQSVLASGLSVAYMKYAGRGFTVLRFPSLSSNVSAALLGSSIAISGYLLDKIFNKNEFNYLMRYCASPIATCGIAMIGLNISKKFIQMTNRDFGIILLIGLLSHFAFKRDIAEIPPSPIVVKKDIVEIPPTHVSDDLAKRMLSNAKKAIEEHHEKKDEQPYASINVLPSHEIIISNKNLPSLKFEYFEAEAQGQRRSMEDEHFFQEFQEGVLTGVFDGHGGRKVATDTSEYFKDKFYEIFRETKENIHRTFELLFDRIHKKVADEAKTSTETNAKYRGTTAVVCYIDKSTHLIYTATLGDSEANIYRKINEQQKSIPLSCVRDWSSKRDALRASLALDEPQIASDWTKKQKPKKIKISTSDVGDKCKQGCWRHKLDSDE